MARVGEMSRLNLRPVIVTPDGSLDFWYDIVALFRIQSTSKATGAENHSKISHFSTPWKT